MEEHYVDADSARLWSCVEVSGSAEAAHPAVLLWSGGPGLADYLSPVARILPAGYRIIRFDPRGCGRSTACTRPHAHEPREHEPRAREGEGLEQTLADIEAIREFYRVERWHVIGHSFGADFALHYAVAHPERLRSLIALAGGRLSESREWYRTVRRRREAREEHQPEFPFPVDLHVKAEMLARWRHALTCPTLLRDIASLQTPATFLYGANDIRPSWPVEQVAGLMPNGRFVELAGCDHFLWRGSPHTLASEIARALSAEPEPGL